MKGKRPEPRFRTPGPVGLPAAHLGGRALLQKPDEVLGPVKLRRGLYYGNDIEIASMYNFTNRMSLACGMIPIKRIESLRPDLRFRVPLGDGAHELEVLR